MKYNEDNVAFLPFQNATLRNISVSDVTLGLLKTQHYIEVL